MPSKYFLKEQKRKKEKIGKSEKEGGKYRERDMLAIFVVVSFLMMYKETTWGCYYR